MNRLDICNSIISIILYFAQIGWLVYGNYIYFNLPLDIPNVYDNTTNPETETVEVGTTPAYTGGQLSA